MLFRHILLTALLGTPALVLALPSAAEAQEPGTPSDAVGGVRVSGHVVDQSTGADLPSVRLVFTPTDSTRDGAWEAQSDSAGYFEIEGLSVGRYEMRVDALAFSTFTRVLTFSERGAIDIRIEMAPAALEMEPVVVTATRLEWLADEGFYERRARSMGYTLTRAEIEGRSPYLVSDLFYGIPGADVISGRTGGRPAFVVLRGRCIPQVVLNGAPFGGPISVDQVLSPGELEAVEVYHGSTGPVRYSNSSCGTIMFWTKRGAGVDEPRPLSWQRVLTAIGLVSWIVFSVR